MLRRIIDFPLYVVVRLLIFCTTLLPVRWRPGLAKGLGGLIQAIPRYRRVVDKNLRLGLGLQDDAQRRVMRRKVYVNVGRHLVETLLYYRLNKQAVRAIIRCDNADVLHRARQPYIVYTAHLGNYEYVGAFMYFQNLSFNVIARRINNIYIDRFANSLREAYGHRMVEKHGALPKIVTGFERGENTFMLIDHNVSRRYGVWVRFFGRPTLSLMIPARLAIKLDLPVIPLFCLREGQGFRIIVREPVPAVKSGTRAFRVWATTQRYMEAIEAVIRRYPEQYFWLHNRWKRRPTEEEAAKYQENLRRYNRLAADG